VTRTTQSALEQRLREIVWSCWWMRGALEAAREVAAPDWLIGAGAIRRLVWDRLHGVAEPPLPDDVDLAFFDPASLRPERENELRSALVVRAPHIPWDVKNQAAVHLWYPTLFGIEVEPLRSAAEAVATWPETATAVALRLGEDGQLAILASYGLSDLLNGVCRRNPRRVSVEEYRRRVHAKGITARWPGVRVIDPDDEPARRHQVPPALGFAADDPSEFTNPRDTPRNRSMGAG
jgi:hypothetical protein